MQLRNSHPNISAAIATELRERIVRGKIAAGSRINEVHLSAELAVSRTPLREALQALVGEGAVESQPRRGFFVRPLTVEEVRDIYPIRAYLDPEALRLSGVPERRRLARLARLRGALQAAAGTEAAIDADDAWHRELWADCPNGVLVDLIERFMQRTRRYELFLMGARAVRRVSAGSKASIEKLLRAGDLDAACALLRERLMQSQEPIVAWLEHRAAEDANS